MARPNLGLSVEPPGQFGGVSLLNESKIEQIVANIRQGTYGWVAATAAGVPVTAFNRWMSVAKKSMEALERGDTLSEHQVACIELRTRVDAAQAEARMAAEQAVLAADPFKWLRYGPGREKPGEPGWSDQVAQTGSDGGPIQVDAVRERLAAELDKIEESRRRVEDRPSIDAEYTVEDRAALERGQSLPEAEFTEVEQDPARVGLVSQDGGDV